jgi:hypothetical protein
MNISGGPVVMKCGKLQVELTLTPTVRKGRVRARHLQHGKLAESHISTFATLLQSEKLEHAAHTKARSGTVLPPNCAPPTFMERTDTVIR